MDSQVKYLGHYDSMLNVDYHAAPGISKSHLDDIDGKSPLHYWAAHLDPNRVRQTSEAFEIGEATHLAVMEPDLLTARVACLPDVDGRTKEGKAIKAAFALEHAGKITLKADDYASILAMRDAVHRHPIARGLFQRGSAEQTYFGIDEDTGELVKCRPDYMLDDHSVIVDLKTCVDASPRGFGKSAANYRYPVQVAWYIDTVKIVTGEIIDSFVFVAVEKQPPHAIGIYYVNEEDVERARGQARQNFLKILHHKRLDQWPDYADTVRELELPKWYAQ